MENNCEHLLSNVYSFIRDKLSGGTHHRTLTRSPNDVKLYSDDNELLGITVDCKYSVINVFLGTEEFVATDDIDIQSEKDFENFLEYLEHLLKCTIRSEQYLGLSRRYEKFDFFLNGKEFRTYTTISYLDRLFKLSKQTPVIRNYKPWIK